MGKDESEFPGHASYAQLRAALKQMRLDASLTQAQLGHALKRSRGFVYRVESGGQNIDLLEFCTWCKACHVQPTTALTPIAKASP